MSDLTYSSYLKLETLLSLQTPRSSPPEHDEMLFIVIHQVYELWFKEMLHELEKVKRDFTEGDLWGAVHTLKRVRMILKTAVGQLDVLETMTPMSFTSFRDRLETASGFQSYQFRELEFVLGYRRPALLKYHPEGSEPRLRLEARLSEPSLWAHFREFLGHHGIAPSAEAGALEDGLLHLYKTRPDLAILFELLTDIDEGMQEWRYRHVKLVERTIGNKQGTGGSLGVEFLKETLFRPFFPDLWAIRHRL